MNYYVSRGGQQFGPYSLADLQKYVAQGNIVATDLACGEGGTQWVPVSQIIGGGAAQPQQPTPQAPIQPGYGQQPVYGQPQGVAPQQPPVSGGPLPPGLHWAIVLLLAFVTCGLFSFIWIFIQANFVKQIRPASQAMMFYIIGIAATLGAGLVLPLMLRSMGMMSISWLLYMGGIVLIIMGHFNMKASLEDYYNTVEPINLRLNGVMVFFFNVLYFQYHFTRIREWKTTGIWR